MQNRPGVGWGWYGLMVAASTICMYNFSTRAENREPSFQKVQTRVRIRRARCGEEVRAENCRHGGQLEIGAQGTPGKFFPMLAIGTRPPESQWQAGPWGLPGPELATLTSHYLEHEEAEVRQGAEILALTERPNLPAVTRAPGHQPRSASGRVAAGPARSGRDRHSQPAGVLCVSTP